MAARMKKGRSRSDDAVVSAKPVGRREPAAGGDRPVAGFVAPVLDGEKLLDILGSFIPEPVEESPFTLQPANGPCLDLRGGGVTGDATGYRLDAGVVEAGARLDLAVEAENIGLDPVTLTVEAAPEWLDIDSGSAPVRLETGDVARLGLGLLACRAPDAAMEGEVRLGLARPTGAYAVTLRVSAQTALAGPVPLFASQGRPCPTHHDFGHLDARVLLAAAEAPDGLPALSVTAGNGGQAPYRLDASLEGEGFTMRVDGQAGGDGLAVAPGGEVVVRVRPAAGLPGVRRALLRLEARDGRSGVLAALALPLTVAVRADGPLLLVRPESDRLVVARDGRAGLGLTVASLGEACASAQVRAVWRDTVLGTVTVALPAGDGSPQPARLDIDAAGLAPGEYALAVHGQGGDETRGLPSARLALSVVEVGVAPALLDFGSIAPGGTCVRELRVDAPEGYVARFSIHNALTPILTAQPVGPNRLRIQADNAPGAPEEPRRYQGPGIRAGIPEIGFSGSVAVHLQRPRATVAAPAAVDFGEAPGGSTVSVPIALTNSGPVAVMVKARTTAPGAVFTPAAALAVPGRGEAVLRLGLPLEPVEYREKREAVPWAIGVELAPADGSPSLRVAVRGSIAPTLGVICPQCGMLNPHGVEMCRVCFESLAGAKPATPDLVRRCPRCGGLFSASFTYCPEDGGALGPLG